MQFGRKSEKLQRQVEQLELRLGSWSRTAAKRNLKRQTGSRHIRFDLDGGAPPLASTPFHIRLIRVLV